MKAVVRRNKQLVCDEIPEPVPGKGEVLVKTLSCGICGSDLHALHSFENMMALGAGGAFEGFQAPEMVFGHEFSAEILDFGPDTARRFKEGTRVVTVPVALTPDGAQTIGYSPTHPGGFGERMILTESMLLEVPNGLSDDQAAMTEPFAVGEHAVATSSVEQDGVPLVIGCGPVGLAVIAGLKARGIGPIIAADFSPARRRVAELMGADIIVDPSKESPHAKWSEAGVATTMAERSVVQMTGGKAKRAIIFECVGVKGVLQSIIAGAPAGSQIVVAGVCMETDAIEPFQAINKQLEFRFVLGYTPGEFANTLTNIADGKIDVMKIITDQVGLAGVADAFVRLGDPETQCKIVVKPSL